MNGVGEDLRQPRVEGVDVGILQPLGGESDTPRPYMGRADRAEEHRAETLLDPLDVGLSLPDR